MSQLIQCHEVGLRAAVGLGNLLTAISFSLTQGEMVGLVGPSGAGKTSLLRLLNRLSEATTGVIMLDGADIRQMPVITLRRQVVLVHQEASLLGQTVHEALLYPLLLQGLSRPKAWDQVSPWLDKLQIPMEWLDRTEVQLSLGQRQRVSLARALALQPRVLLLDEPTSSQDVGSSQRMGALLQQITREQETTVLMANHDLSLVERYCDRLLYLAEGSLKQDTVIDAVDWPTLKNALTQAKQQDDELWE